MSKIVHIKIFNELLSQFMEYLEENFPKFKSDLLLTGTSISFIRKSNPRLVVEMFMKTVGKYSKQIEECDERFFLNFDQNLDKSHLTTDNIMFGMKIKNMWLSTDPPITDIQKAHIWLYFQKLLKCGNQI